MATAMAESPAARNATGTKSVPKKSWSVTQAATKVASATSEAPRAVCHTSRA